MNLFLGGRDGGKSGGSGGGGGSRGSAGGGGGAGTDGFSAGVDDATDEVLRRARNMSMTSSKPRSSIGSNTNSNASGAQLSAGVHLDATQVRRVRSGGFRLPLGEAITRLETNATPREMPVIPVLSNACSQFGWCDVPRDSDGNSQFRSFPTWFPHNPHTTHTRRRGVISTRPVRTTHPGGEI